jgi:hypothetical protein
MATRIAWDDSGAGRIPSVWANSVAALNTSVWFTATASMNPSRHNWLRSGESPW